MDRNRAHFPGSGPGNDEELTMASVYDLKPKFQNLLRPLAWGLASRGVTANQVTLAALGLSCGTGAFLAFYPGKTRFLLAVPVVLFVRMALNAIDGMMARECNMKTPTGAVLNELGDVVSDTALYGALAWIPGLPGFWIVLMLLLAMLSEMAGVVSVQIGASRRYDGPMGKSDRAFVLGVLTLVLGLGIGPGAWMQYVWMGIDGLLILTIWNRASRALREVGS